MAITLALLVLLMAPATAIADILVPPGFVVDVYVTGEGFDTADGRAAHGLPSSSTLAVDGTGTLYMARTGRRYSGGEIDDLWPVFRFPPGGARVTKATASRFLYGPPLPSAQVAGLRGDGQLLITTFNRDRKVGVLYVMVNGHPELFAGGTPATRTMAPMLVQPEGAAVDAAGNIYVADRGRDRVLKLDPRGAVLEASHVSVKRPRLLAVAGDGALWIAADGGAEAPWQRGPGEIWRRAVDGVAQLVRHGPVATGMSLATTGHLFVADRQAAEIFALTTEGRSLPFARFTDGDAPRALAFAPVTPDTERAGIAGNLFLVTIRRGAWPVNEVLRISGPFEQFLRESPPPVR